MSISSIHASLLIRDFGSDPSIVTAILGIEPSTSGRKGDRRLGPEGQPMNHIVKDTFWSLKSRREPGASIEEHARDLLDQVEVVRSRLRELPPGTSVAFSYTVIPDRPYPVFRLERETLARIAAIGGVLDIVQVSVSGAPDDDA